MPTTDALTRKRRVRVTLEFDGAPFTGWQRQAAGRSVQGELERALAGLLGERITVIGAGRTDAGVHALGMVAHFDTTRGIPADRLPRALRAHLPPEISVLAGHDADPRFDARRDALLRWYRFQIDPGRIHRPLRARVWRPGQDLDVASMESAVELLRGKHDFSGFRAASCTAPRTRLTMREASLTRCAAPGAAIARGLDIEGAAGNADGAGRDELLLIDFKCRSFLQRMVRMLVGTLVEIGRGRLPPGAISDILEGAPRPDTVACAPPEGLCLVGIAYTEEEAERMLNACPAEAMF